MKPGTLYGIGVGPGDPEWITLKGVNLLARCRHIFVPKGQIAGDSTALAIARPHVNPDSTVYELLFPMTTDRAELARRWDESARQIYDVLGTGEDACFLTLGDPFLYSTYIYLLRAMRALAPDLTVVTVPGITSMSAAASLTEFPVGEGKEWVTIVPAADDYAVLERALSQGGTVVLMKIGKRLEAILDLLERKGLTDQAVLVARAGCRDQRIETDLRKVKGEAPEAGYLSIMLIHADKETCP